MAADNGNRRLLNNSMRAVNLQILYIFYYLAILFLGKDRQLLTWGQEKTCMMIFISKWFEVAKYKKLEFMTNRIVK